MTSVLRSGAQRLLAQAVEMEVTAFIAARCPRVRDRGGAGEAGKIRFTSAILPPYLRRAKSIEELLPWL